MGSIVQRQHTSAVNTLCDQQKQPLSLSRCSRTAILHNGLAIVSMNDGTSGLYYSKLLVQASQKTVAEKWVKESYRHSCNVLRYDVKTLSMFCNTHVTITAIVEYGSQSLAQILNEKDEKGNNTMMILDKSQTQATERTFNTSVEVLQLIKCLIQATEEHLNTRKTWITFHTTNVIHFADNTCFKYLYIPQFDELMERETFFDPYAGVSGGNQTQLTTVFSIGMILMSLLLREDSSDCYNFQNLSFCWSIFEEKKQKIKEELTKRAPKDSSYSRIGSTLEEDLYQLTLATLASAQNRATFLQVKKLYFRLLRRIPTFSYSGREEEIKRRGVRDAEWKVPYGKDPKSNAQQLQDKENRCGQNAGGDLEHLQSASCVHDSRSRCDSQVLKHKQFVNVRKLYVRGDRKFLTKR